MARRVSKEVSELADAGVLHGTELVHVVKQGVSRRTTTATIANLATGGGLVASAVTNDSGVAGATVAAALDTLEAAIGGGGGGGAVDSVNGQTGVVVVDADDISDSGTTHKFTTASDIAKLAGIEAGATADQTAAEILTAIKTVDGAGSGLDADLLDGNSSAAFATAAQGATADAALPAASYTAADILTKIKTVDGAGSGLDADLLDGQSSAAFQPVDATLTSLAALGTAADKIAYTTGVDTWAEAALTTFGRSLIDDADASAGRTTLGLVIGTNVQAFDATLLSIAALGTAADKIGYTTGVDTWAETPLTAFGRSLIDDAAASNARTTLGLVIGTDVQAYDAELAAMAGLTSAADKVPYFTGSGTAGVADFTSVGRTLVGQTTQALMRTTGLGLSANGSSLVVAADYAAMRALLDLEAATDFYSITAADAAFQPKDADLTAIAGLTATSDNFLQSKASAWASRTPTQVTADLIAMVGDSGSGGTKGLVPAPGAGDAAASKFLKADGTWAAPAGSGSGDVVGPAASVDSEIALFSSTTGKLIKRATQTGLLKGTSGVLSALATGAADKHLVSDGTDPLWLEAFGHALGMVNGTLVPSVGSSALTIALKTLAGADPSASDPVWVFFRSATAANGDYAKIKVTAATSIIISSGSSLGAPTGSVPFKVWIVGFNDAGTFRLGAMVATTLASGVLTQYPLAAWGIASSTAEGAAGAADSAQTFYTGTAVTSKAYATLGYLSYESGLSAAGTWASTPTRTQLFGPGVALPGVVVQNSLNVTGSHTSGTTLQNLDDTKPQNTEGFQLITQPIAPSSGANILLVSFGGWASASGTSGIIVGLHQDSVADALSAAEATSPANGYAVWIGLVHPMIAALTSTTTFKIRMGPNTGVTVYSNGYAGRYFGGAANTYLRIEEIAS